MGLVSYRHVKRSGAARIKGALDSLRVLMLPVRRHANGTPPYGVRNSPSGAAVPDSTATSLSAPPPAATARERPPALPAVSYPDVEQSNPDRQQPVEGNDARMTGRQRRQWWLEMRAAHWPESLSREQRVELAAYETLKFVDRLMAPPLSTRSQPAETADSQAELQPEREPVMPRPQPAHDVGARAARLRFLELKARMWPEKFLVPQRRELAALRRELGSGQDTACIDLIACDGER